MSGISESCVCPNCNMDANEYSDRKPFNYVVINCYHCGLSINPIISYMDLDTLNNEREKNEMRILDKLPFIQNTNL